MRGSGTVIDYNRMIAIVMGIVGSNDRTLQGIVGSNDRTLQKEIGGTIELGIRSCESLSKAMGLVKRKTTTAKPIIVPGLILEIGHTFYHDINEIVKFLNIPPEMIININRTPLS